MRRLSRKLRIRFHLKWERSSSFLAFRHARLTQAFEVAGLVCQQRGWHALAQLLHGHPGIVPQELGEGGGRLLLVAGLGVVGSQHAVGPGDAGTAVRSEEHTSELQSLMRISYAVFCLKKKK